MGKKAAHSGESPKDRSINMMDKFITRNDRRRKRHEQLPALETKDVINTKTYYQLDASHQMYLLTYGH